MSGCCVSIVSPSCDDEMLLSCVFDEDDDAERAEEDVEVVTGMVYGGNVVGGKV
jgi:hypothetical protein